jgi:hypothetical protein
LLIKGSLRWKKPVNEGPQLRVSPELKGGEYEDEDEFEYD